MTKIVRGEHRVLEVIHNDTAVVYYASIEPREIHRVEIDIASGRIESIEEVEQIEILNESGIVLEAPVSTVWSKFRKQWDYDFLVFVNSSGEDCRYSLLVEEQRVRNLSFAYPIGSTPDWNRVRCGDTVKDLHYVGKNGKLSCDVSCSSSNLSFRSFWCAAVRPESRVAFDVHLTLKCRHDKFTKVVRVFLSSPPNPEELGEEELRDYGILTRWYGTHSPVKITAVIG